jgi:hypothetical protein
MKYFFILILLGFWCSGFSQSRPLEGTYDETLEEENFVDPDSVDYESYTKKTSSFKALFNGKPGQAIMYGLLIPSGGQAYNRKYWKIPFALAAEAGAIATFIYLRNEFNTLTDGYALVLEGEEINYKGLTTADQFNSYRKRYQKWSEQAGVAMIVVHIIVAVEAYINRHLIDFDIDEDLSFGIKSIPNIGNRYIKAGGNLGLSLSYSF